MTGPIYARRPGGKDYEAFVVEGFFYLSKPLFIESLIITGAIHGVTPSVEGARKMQQLLLHPV